MATTGAGAGSQVGGATPWWQLNNGGVSGAATLSNLQSSAPAGYQYDPVQMQYVRTPVSVGKDLGAEFSGLASAAPGGVSSILNNPLTPGTAGAAAGLSGAGGGLPPHVGAGGSVGIDSTSSSPFTPPGGGSVGNVAPIQSPDLTAAHAAAFASAKDQVGQTSRAALTGLAGAMAGRGVVGSGVEGRGQVGVINQGQQQLGDVSRSEAEDSAAQAEQNALAQFQGDVSQRGQTLQNQQANTGFGVTQRGQDIQANEAAGQLGLGYSDLDLRRSMAALSALKGFNINSGGGGYGGSAAY